MEQHVQTVHKKTVVRPEWWERILWQEGDAEEEDNVRIIAVWQRPDADERRPLLRSRSPRRRSRSPRRHGSLANISTRELVQELMRRFG